jgi:catechol 2,3-dioxygenase-like lactoylglutathione lyase family enzyme
VSVAALDHVLILTDDLEATRAFYRDVVGLTVGERPPLPFPGYWLYAGGVACLHVAERGPYLAHARKLGLSGTGADVDVDGAPAVDHVSFSAHDGDGVRARLAAAGVAPVANEIADAGVHQLFFADPNGVRLEINVS